MNKKLKIDDNISLYQLVQVIKLVLEKLNLDFDEKEIPENIKRHFK